jgi:hypothetical protein
MSRAAVLFVAIVVAAPAAAHHGGGTFDSRRAITLTGKLTRIDFTRMDRYGQYVKAPAGGDKIAATFEVFSPKDNPRLRCETTSIVFDWTFDGPVNRITQNRDTIVIQHGQLGLKRTIHMNLKQHPAGVKPSRAGHSIDRWENDVLVVDTVAFLPGVLSPPVMNSDKLHVVERFSLDPKTLILTRSYVADDPVYLKGQYSGSDTVQVADAPYVDDNCKELGYLDYSKQAQTR